MRKNQSLALIAYTIVYALYFILTIMFITPKTAAFWISYVFTVIAFLLVLGTVFLVKGDKTGDVFYGIPLVLSGNSYLILQLILGAVLTLIRPTAKITFALEIIPLALFGIVAVSTLLGRNITENQEVTENTKIAYLHRLEGVLQHCEAVAQDADLRSQLASLKEKVHYSDPMSNNSLFELENQMLELAKQIRSEAGNDPETAKQHCHLLETMLEDRNQKCKSLK